MMTVLIVLALIIIAFVAYRILQNKRLRDDVLSLRREFLFLDEFMKKWEEGLNHVERSGCYCLFFYDKEIDVNSLPERRQYKYLYVGQSKDIFYRVHEHLTGRGNDSAMRLVSHGTPVYAVFLPCSLWRMNPYEKQLISVFNATGDRGLNKQSGGARRRE